MKRITLTSKYRNTQAGFIPRPTANPKIGTVSMATQARIRRILGDGIECYAGDGWDVSHIDFYRVLYIKYH